VWFRTLFISSELSRGCDIERWEVSQRFQFTKYPGCRRSAYEKEN